MNVLGHRRNHRVHIVNQERPGFALCGASVAGMTEAMIPCDCRKCSRSEVKKNIPVEAGRNDRMAPIQLAEA